MNYIIILTETKFKGSEIGTEKLLDSVAFSTKESADNYLKIYSENMGYTLTYNEDGQITGAMYFNARKKIRIIINFGTLELINK